MIMRMFNQLMPANRDFVFKHRSGVEVVLPTEVGKHMPYDPRLLPVVQEEKNCGFSLSEIYSIGRH